MIETNKGKNEMIEKLVLKLISVIERMVSSCIFVFGPWRRVGGDKNVCRTPLVSYIFDYSYAKI